MITNYNFAPPSVLGTRFDSSSSLYFSQHGYTSAPDTANPLRGLASTDELTIVTSAKHDNFNNTTGDTNRFQFYLGGNSPGINLMARCSGSGGIFRYWTFELTNFAGTVIKSFTVFFQDIYSGTWIWSDWYVILISYKKSPATLLFRLINMTRGNEHAADQTGLTALTITPSSIPATGSSGTFFNWGWSGSTVNFNSMRGTISQTVVAPEFRDFTVLSERQKFATTAGMKNFGAEFVNPWLYTNTGDIRNATGLIGALPGTHGLCRAHVDGITPPLV